MCFNQKQIPIILILIVTGLYATGCLKQTETAKSSVNANNIEVNAKQAEQNMQLGYVAVYNNLAMFIRWTEVDKKLSGQLQIASLAGKNVENLTHAFSGIINNSDISISFSGSVWTDSWSGKTWTGTIRDNKLTLVYPAKDGSLQTLLFNSGSITDYNQALGNLQNQGAIQANADAYQQKQKETYNSLNSSLGNLRRDTSRLASINFDNDIKIIQTSLVTMQKHYEQLKKDASVIPLTNYQLNHVVKYDLNVEMAYDLNTNLSYNLNNDLGYDIREAQQLSSYVSQEITILQNSWQEYLKYNSSTSQFNQDTISSSITLAKEQQTLLEKKISSAQGLGNYYYDQGKQLYQTAKNFVAGLTSTGSN